MPKLVNTSSIVKGHWRFFWHSKMVQHLDITPNSQRDAKRISHSLSCPPHRHEDHQVGKEADGEPDEGKKSGMDQVPLLLYSLSEQRRGLHNFTGSRFT